uniref:Conserved plasma membrane protein n=1 Tax=Anisakis simplex TaxID=6269 RepID=A0A0M3JPQ3_ANISI
LRGSRSKSAVRSQRSLSVARAGDSLNDAHVDACVHKQHTRLETLKTFQAAKNRLQEIPLMLPNTSFPPPSLSPRKKIRDARLKDNNSSHNNVCSILMMIIVIGTCLG